MIIDEKSLISKSYLRGIIENKLKELFIEFEKIDKYYWSNINLNKEALSVGSYTFGHFLCKATIEVMTDDCWRSHNNEYVILEFPIEYLDFTLSKKDIKRMKEETDYWEMIECRDKEEKDRYDAMIRKFYKEQENGYRIFHGIKNNANY